MNRWNKHQELIYSTKGVFFGGKPWWRVWVHAENCWTFSFQDQLSRASSFESMFHMFHLSTELFTQKQHLGGGNSNMFYVHPEPWGRCPFWLAYFSKGLKPPTRHGFHTGMVEVTPQPLACYHALFVLTARESSLPPRYSWINRT